jgi:D-lactate dehydrogenase (cytochrome)
MPSTGATSAQQKHLLDALRTAVGPKQVLTDSASLEPYINEWRGIERGECMTVVRPGTPEEVSRVMALCFEHHIPVTPQGGNTGMVAGAVPQGGIVLSTERLSSIRSVDTVNATMTVEAGCVLATVREHAAAHDMTFPLTLASQGSCFVGGNIATNAGGNHTVRFGNTRENVLGLEVVLPDGRIWNGLSGLRKDNTGYDLKQLFVGAEGTLGIITAAVLRLYPRPRETATAIAAVRDVEAALALLHRIQDATAQAVTSCELMPRRGIELAQKHVADTQDPLEGRPAWCVLVEAAGGTGDGGLKRAMEAALMAAYEAGLVTDAVPAESAGQRRAFWHLREAIVEAQRHEGASIKHDIAVPVASVPAFLTQALARVEEMVPGIRPVPFGHLGDGNLHFNLTQPEDADPAAFLARWDEVNAAVHDIVHAFGGSISAEHGVGRMKVGEIERFKPDVEIEMMRAIKRTLDPLNIMNPGKVVKV